MTDWNDRKQCPRCFGEKTIKKGIQKKTGKQKYYCKDCQKYFSPDYSNRSFRRSFSDRVKTELKNNSVRETAKILNLSPTTVQKYKRDNVSPGNIVSAITVLDLFSGIGGFSLGLERTGGFKTVAFCEIDKKCQKVLDKHWPEVKKYNDVRTISREQLNNDGIKNPEVICGGFPCQDISCAGRQDGLNGSRSGLWAEFKRLISEIRPEFAIVENVRNLLSGQRGTWFGKILGDLAEIGYDAEWHVISAAAIGAPHLRERVWIVAYPEGERCGKERKHCERSEKRITGSSEALAHPEIKGMETRICEADGKKTVTISKRHRSTLPDTDPLNENDRRFRTGKIPLIEPSGVPASEFWATEPPICRVVDGFSGRVDRLKQLGNAVVPQIPELIGNAILESVNN
jgi:DNA (cytosine-5)-methyltransferase 1